MVGSAETLPKKRLVVLKGSGETSQDGSVKYPRSNM
jgi:hypothetical protein